MKNLQGSKNWLHHVVPLTITLVALIVVVMAPFWAFGWAQIPFMGIFLEPHNVVSALEGDNWPAKNAGVQSYDRLIAINGESTLSSDEVSQVLQQNGFNPVEIGFETRQGDTYQVMVTPRPFRVGELASWFGVPYAVGLAFLGIGLWAYRMSKEQRPARAFLAFTAAFSVGINVGDALVGNIGTPDLFNYTAIGDTVNYAQRLESIGDPGQIIVQKMPPVKVKGKAEAALVYELIGLK